MKKGILYAIGFFLLLGACMAAIGEDETQTAATSPGPSAGESNDSAKEESKSAKIGDTVKAGDLTYKVISVETKKEIKDPIGGVYKPGAGQYIVLELEVKNEGKEKITMDTTLTKLVDDEGAEYEADPQADTWVNGNGGQALGFFLEPINPHAKKKAKVVFDTPEKPVKSFTFIGQGGFLSGDEVKIQLEK